MHQKGVIPDARLGKRHCGRTRTVNCRGLTRTGFRVWQPFLGNTDDADLAQSVSSVFPERMLPDTEAIRSAGSNPRRPARPLSALVRDDAVEPTSCRQVRQPHRVSPDYRTWIGTVTLGGSGANGRFGPAGGGGGSVMKSGSPNLSVSSPAADGVSAKS